MWESKPPPLLVILLWQHFCYYKRHKILLTSSIVLPFLLLGFLFFTTRQNETSPEEQCKQYPKSRQQTVSLLSSGVLQYVEGSYSCYQGGYSPPRMYNYTPSDISYTTFSFDQSLLNYQLLNTKPQCENSILNVGENVTCQTLESDSRQISNWHNYDPSVFLVAGYIVYYPNTSKQAENIMNLVRRRLEAYSTFVNKTAKSESTAKSKDPKWASLNYFAKLTTACWTEVPFRVLGFATKNDLLSFTQNNLSQIAHNPLPLLWGAINFEKTDEAFNNDNKFVYSMMYATSYVYTNNRDIWVQDLVEEAAIRLITNGSALSITPMVKELPSKSWIKSSGHAAMQTNLPFFLTVGLSIFPSTFLILIVEEKMLKLREYLNIMGVNDVCLKLSWIVFFALFLVPISILLCIIIHCMPGGMFMHSDISLLFVIIILYSLSQLFWVYLVSTVMKTPAGATFIIAFFNVMFNALSYSIYVYGSGKLTGKYMVMARLFSLHTAVPFGLALCYYIGWEAIWIPAKWKYFFFTPTVGDQYGGFGECILWMIGDSILYLTLAWYFQHLFPGEYGVKYPFYFIFQPSFWFPTKFGEKYTLVPQEHSLADIELYNLENEAGIVLESLTKYYTKDKFGIDQLSVSFYKNEVTAFLGENGAGKTTTMNILVGLINPTNGKAWINGMNVSKQMSEIRKFISFVPQYDILYPGMTVEEHIQFFGWLQGLSKTQTWDDMDSLLKTFDMMAQKKNLTTDLSGGQKRKLSVLTAYIGNPQVVILDEPTSGVDPFSRRAIWDIVSKHRQKTTTILSTHYMQEADVLGDRIAIISTGKLQCVGSPMYLKNRYGKGYRLTITIDSTIEHANNLIEEFLKNKIPNTKLIQENGNEKTYSIPIEIAQSEKMVHFLQEIEEQQSNLGIVAFGVTEPSMEEVFFAATGSRPELNVKPQGTHDSQHPFTKIEARHTQSSPFKQFSALFYKRILLTFRSPSLIFLQILLPLFLVCVMHLINSGFNESGSNVVDFYAPYKQNVFFFQNQNGMGIEFLNAASQYGLNPQNPVPGSRNMLTFPTLSYKFDGDCDACSSDYCSSEQALNYASNVIPSNEIVYPLDSAANVSAWILHANQTNHWVAGGFQFFKMPSDVYKLNNHIDNEYKIHSSILNETTVLDYAVLWTEPHHNLAMLNAFNNLLLRINKPSWSIVLSREPAQLISTSSNIYAVISSFVQSVITCYFLIMAYVFATFGIANIVQQEKSIGLKRLQFISGANPVVYWMSNMAWDLVQITFTITLTFILLGVFSNPFNNDSFRDLHIVAIILLPFAVGTLAFTYLMTFVSDTSQALNRNTSLIAFFALIIGNTLAIFAVMNDGGHADFHWMTSVSHVLCLFPYYYVSETISYLAYSQSLHQFNPLAAMKFKNLLQFDLLGRRIIEAWISAIILFSLVIILEYMTCNPFRRSTKLSPLSKTYQQIADSDVRAEAEKIKANQYAEDDPLVVREVYKLYKKQPVPAVNGVSFSIPRGQCFGLLGINGAGKTSLFKILAGFQDATMGSATIEGLDVKTNWRKIGEKMGYCPQENTIFDKLTPKEHLQLVGRLRGIQSDRLENATTDMMRKVGLDIDSKKKAIELSGGNQRKLQFAMALLDYRPLIFLDEPTTGMDPSARRLAWNSINEAVTHGCSVVLTSHSMEECEMLCHRLVIMVLGNFSCIGSVQYLKNKLGNSYIFKLKLNPNHDSQSVGQLKEYIRQHLPNAALIEEHSTLLVFEISAESLRVSALFSLFCETKRNFPSLVEDFATSQVSLEHVFVKMAERQRMLQEGFPVAFNIA